MNIRKLCILIYAIAIFLPLPSQLQELNTELEAKIDAVISEAIREGQLIGCNALIYKDGKVEYYRNWGLRDREAGKPLERNSIFRIYSMTKPITSVAAMQLVEQKKINLDDPVLKYLPEFAQMTVLQKNDSADKAGQKDPFIEVPALRDITIRDLFRHTSGFTYGFTGDTEVDKKYLKAGVLFTDRDLEVMMIKLAKIPLLYQPGTHFHYSVSTDVLARVIEVVSGQRFDEYLDGHIFKPLGMTDTSFIIPPEKLIRLAQLYVPDKKGVLKPAPQIQSLRFLYQKNEFFSGGIGLCSTIDDYLKFSTMLLNRGQLDETRIIDPEMVDLIFTDQLKDVMDRPPGFRFGLGFEISKRGDYSWGGAAGTRFWLHPDKKMVVLFMTQILPYEPRTIAEQIRDLVYTQLSKNMAPGR